MTRSAARPDRRSSATLARRAAAGLRHPVRRAAALDPRVLMVGQKRVEGFWLSEWGAASGTVTMALLFRRIGQLMQEGVLTTEVGATFPLDEVRAAVRQAADAGAAGQGAAPHRLSLMRDHAGR